MGDYDTSGGSPLSQTIDFVLGHELSPRGRQFTAKHADFLSRVDFRDIAHHPIPEVCSGEGCYFSDGLRYTIWLDRENPNFEGLLMHEIMRGIMMEQGFPKTTYSPELALFPLLPYLSYMLSSTITDPVIDRHLAQGGFEVYDRKVLIHRTTAQIWPDAGQGAPEPYGFFFCKWTLFTVLLSLDPTFEGDAADTLRGLIHEKFPEPADLGDRLSACIKETGFVDPYSALVAMVSLRNALKLHEEIDVVDGWGIRW